ncbi:MAG: hypothetical protein ABIQ30_07690 [Devosia sp.]
MSQIETSYRIVPTASGTASRFSAYRGSPKAGFLSQLIAERHHLSLQRTKRQAPIAEVLRTYDEGGKLKVLRMPPGYRTNIEA